MTKLEFKLELISDYEARIKKIQREKDKLKREQEVLQDVVADLKNMTIPTQYYTDVDNKYDFLKNKIIQYLEIIQSGEVITFKREAPSDKIDELRHLELIMEGITNE